MVNIKIRLIIFFAAKDREGLCSQQKQDLELTVAQIMKMKKVGKTTRPDRYDPPDYTVEVTNRFKGLDLTDRVPDELWMEVHDTVQETRDQDHPQEKEMQKSKMVV